jgi:two-component system, OmpR family, sensor histidine kinase KdpD
MGGVAVRPRHELIEREARVSGLRDFRTPTLEAVERRRLQLWAVALVILIVLTVGTVLVSLLPSIPRRAGFNVPAEVRIGMVAIALAFCAYVVEKERALRRLTQMLIDERVLSAALSNRLKELSTLAAVGKAVNSVLNLEDVLDIILSSAIELLEGNGGSIMLLDSGDMLKALCVHGNEPARGARVPIGSSISGEVAATREPLLISGAADPQRFTNLTPREHPVSSSVSVPLVHRDQLLGVLNVSGGSGRLFTEYDLRAMTLFAEHAAISIANANLYEAQVERVAELMEVNRLKSEFVANVSHELRTPLTSILGSVITLRNLDLGLLEREEFLDTIERQGRRLLRLIEELLTAAKLEQGGVRGIDLGPVDVAAVARAIARDEGLARNAIEVEAPEFCPALANADLVQRVLLNLVDNANKYGAPPIRILVEEEGGTVMLTVMDQGPGIRAKDRDRIFDRFTRLDATGSLPGMGLGLPIARDLLAACGGRVWVEEAPGGGAAFRVALPAPARQEAVS